MLAKGLEVQLSAMAARDASGSTMDTEIAKHYREVRAKLKQCYTKVWETIEASKAHSMAEVWSWRWKEASQGGERGGAGGFDYVPLSHVETPGGGRQTESNALQLWSLAILALERKGELEIW